MKFRRCVLALCLAATAVSAEVINVADHGLVPGEDATLPLFRLMEKIRGQEDITLQFSQGIYTFLPDNAFEAYRAVSNHDNGLKRIPFPIFDFKGLTIDGGGAEFVFDGRMIPFVLERGDGITLKNFAIDWKRPFQTEMLVVESGPDDNAFVVEIDPETFPHEVKNGTLLFTHYDWQDTLGFNVVLDPQTRAPIAESASYGLPREGVYAEQLEGNRVRLSAADMAPPPLGSTLVSYGNSPTGRLSPAIHVANSRNIAVENVTVYAAGGMGLIAERTENIRLDRFNVTTRPGGKRMVSTCADAAHFVGCQGTVSIENCLFEHTLEDAVNVHGVYVKVVEFLGNLKYLCELSHPQQWGVTFAQPGDWVSLIWRETVLSLYETTVVNIDILNERRFILTLNKLPDFLPDGLLSIENLTWYPEFTMRNSIVRGNRARGILATTKGKTTIENNVISSQDSGILIGGDNNVSYESGGVEDILIRNNIFENTGSGGRGGYALYVAPSLSTEQRDGQIQYHRNIRFLDNEVRSFNAEFLFARSVSELHVSDNRFIRSTAYVDTGDAPAIDIRHCRNVVIEKNTVAGFDPAPVIAVSEDSEGIDLSRQRGFTVLQPYPAEENQ